MVLKVLKVILLDDEELLLSMLEMQLQKIENVEIVGKYMNPILFLEELNRLKVENHLPNVVFVDIEMPEMNGLEVAERIREISECIQIVFVTAYSIYAVQAFELNSVDYLLKPVMQNRLEKTILRIQQLLGTTYLPERSVHIQCFGDFAMYNGNSKERLKWRTNKVKELCAYLIHFYYRTLSVNELIELLYSELNYEKAKDNLYNTISSLRRTFKNAGLSQVIKKNENGYYLDFTSLNCDFFQVQELLSKSEDVNANSISNFERIFDLYQGDYFSNIEQIEFIPMREDFRYKVVQILRQMARYYKSINNETLLFQALTKIIIITPGSEEDVFELIKLYCRQGNRIKAIEVYQNLLTFLKDYDIEPNEEMRTFIHSVKDY